MEWITDIIRGLFGLFVLLGFCYLISRNRKAIDWRLVGVGITMQLVLAILILKVSFVSLIFDYLAEGFRQILNFTEAGATFLFGNIVTDLDSFGYIFAFQVLPTIVFFSAFSAILYYFGLLQKIVYGLAWLMSRTMGLSGPESLAAAANVFIGQTEAPLVVKPYLEKMTTSEIMCLMTGGMATIAGGVFAAYVGYLGGDDPLREVYFAKHLLTASIISAPAAIVAAKMLVPEDHQKNIDEQLEMTEDNANNLLDAISRGTTDGLKLAINVGAMLLVFTALIYMVNQILSGSLGHWIFFEGTITSDWLAPLNKYIMESGAAVGDLTTVKMRLNGWVVYWTDGRFEGFTFTYILGVLFAPIAWILGTPTSDILVIGQLLGQKTVINEFIAYAELKTIREAGVQLQEKSLIIATYALCGFANFASIGIQIGGIGAIAPGQRKTLTEYGIWALIGGTIACFLTASIAGMIT